MSDNEIDETAVQEALGRAEKSLTGEDYAATQAAIYKMISILSFRMLARSLDPVLSADCDAMIGNARILEIRGYVIHPL